MKWFKENFALLLLLILALFLRTYRLGLAPPGLWFDESAYGYSAYSILKTGKDELGRFLPLSFRFFGQNNLFGHFLILVPFIRFFGLSPFSVRFASVVLGTLSGLGIYLIGKKIFNKPVALASLFIWATLPVALQFNRMVHENNSMVFFLVFGIYFWLKAASSKKPRDWLLSAFMFSGSLYTYLAARIITPLVIIFLFYNYRPKNNKNWFKSFILSFLILSLPFFIFLSSPQAWPRVKQVGLLNDLGLISQINESRMYSSFKFDRLIYNKPIEIGKQLILNLGLHLFSVDYLFFKGDPNPIYNTPRMGLLFLWQAPFLGLGFYSLFKTKQVKARFIAGLVLVGVLPAVLSRLVPSSSRSFFMFVPISLVVGLGLYQAWRQLKKPLVKKSFFIFLALVVVWFQVAWFDAYFNQLPKRYAYEWRQNSNLVINRILNLKKDYSSIIFDQEAIADVNFLFYSKYDPQKLQNQQPKISPRDKFGNSHIYHFDNYWFSQNPKEFAQKDLFVGFCSPPSTSSALIDKISINEKSSYCIYEN